MPYKKDFTYIKQIICKYEDKNDIKCSLFNIEDDKFDMNIKTVRLDSMLDEESGIMESFNVNSIAITRDIKGFPMISISFIQPLKCKIKKGNKDYPILTCKDYSITKEGIIILD